MEMKKATMVSMPEKKKGGWVARRGRVVGHRSSPSKTSASPRDRVVVWHQVWPRGKDGGGKSSRNYGAVNDTTSMYGSRIHLLCPYKKERRAYRQRARLPSAHTTTVKTEFSHGEL